MGEYYTYQKKRREYGKFCNFADTEVSVHGFDFDAESSKKRGWEYKKRDPNFITFDNVPKNLCNGGCEADPDPHAFVHRRGFLGQEYFTAKFLQREFCVDFCKLRVNLAVTFGVDFR